MLRRSIGPALGTLAVVIALGAAAAPAQADPQAQVLERKENFKKLGAAMKTLSDFVKGEGGTAADAQAAARVIVDHGAGIGEWFPAGTAVGVGKSEAKPAIWTDTADFTDKVAKFKAAGPALVSAAETGDAKAVGAQLRAVGGTCKACHDTYRLDD